MSDSALSNSLDSGVLRTTRAFKRQIESRTGLGDGSSLSILSWSILGALSQLRKSLREVCKEIGQDSVSLRLEEDDEFGWPRLTLSSIHGESVGVRLVVGAQDRRKGTVLLLRLPPTSLELEMQEAEYSQKENIERTLRLFLRRFFDEVAKKVEDERSLDKQFSNLLESLDVPEVPTMAANEQSKLLSGEDLFPSTLPDPGPLLEEEETLDIDSDEFFK